MDGHGFGAFFLIFRLKKYIIVPAFGGSQSIKKDLWVIIFLFHKLVFDL